MCNKSCLDSILKIIKKRSEELFKDKLDAVLLYGSYARGDFDNESDIDVMILVDMNKNELLKYRKDIYKIAHDIGFESDVLVSPHLQDKETFENWTEVLPYYKNIRNEGILVEH